MNSRPTVAVTFLILLLLTLGCRKHDDVHARYTLERTLWKAQVQQRKINIAFIKASQHDLELAIDDFNKLLSYDPFFIHNTDDWDPRVVRDIRRIQIVSKIALANLYFLSEQYYLAGDFFERTLNEANLDFQRRLEVQLDLVKSLYFAGEEETFEENCAAIFKDIAESREFWTGGFELDDQFLSIPLVLVRYYRDRGIDDKYEEFKKLAEDFYTRVAETLDDRALADKAVYSRASLHLLCEDWRAALADLDELLQNPAFGGQRENLLLLKGEVLAYALDRVETSRSVFESLVRSARGTTAGFAARYNLGLLALEGGDAKAGMDALKELESEPGVPDDIAAKSMLARAGQIERAGRWDEALLLLRRIMRLHPETPSAIEAPLAITRHYAAAGEEQMAMRNLERATEFYVSLITRQSKFRGDRLLVEDFLIENYLTMGMAREVAEILEDRSPEWDEVSSVSGMFKSALIYSTILNDKEGAERVLRKSIELFPQKRYAKIAQRHLDLLTRQTNDVENGG
jgi:tetratricopeptide (TPR) repeat protein